ncbi:hypothetical protein BJF90_07320 [Pseudonocardia sp. CNS-004]|nr:hypothetical protein BJF90_07320 [Pseudonocardia sp. CNS-004]
MDGSRRHPVRGPPRAPHRGEQAGRLGRRGRYFTTGALKADAVAATADQLQDHAIEATGGAALPARPGHAHPLSARVLDGVAHWVCPQDPPHHWEPILPTDAR